MATNPISGLIPRGSLGLKLLLVCLLVLAMGIPLLVVGALVAEREGRAREAGVELDALRAAAVQATALGLEVHAGHGIDYDTVEPIAAIPEVVELNIGHFLVGEAIFIGLEAAIGQMRGLMDQARA